MKHVNLAMEKAGYWGPAPDQEATIDEVVSGGATGIDLLGEDWALYQLVPCKRFPAEWRNKGIYDKAAGIRRNIQMGDYVANSEGGGGLVAIWNGRSPGTGHMIKYATKLKLKAYIYIVEDKAKI